jgi:alkylation response protein AidB-like acyl-CoA dehydrogenase
VDATFTETQELLADVAGRIAAGSMEDGATPGQAWSAVVDAGLLGLHLAEERGGGGAGVVELAIVAEALGRVVAPVPFAGPVLALELLAAAGAPDEWLLGVADGHRRATLALDPTLGAPAALEGDGPSLGFDATGAGHFVGLHRTTGGTGAGGQGVAVATGRGTPKGSADLTRDLVEVPTVEVEQVGGSLDPGALVRWEALAQVVLCADMAGAMRGALDLAVVHARERQQFGRPVGSFQAVQHLAADQHVSCEASRRITYYAAWAVDQLDADQALLAALTAKAYVGPRAREVTEAVLQIHGGMGHTWENRPHLFLRRALLDRAVLGDESAVLPRIAAMPFHQPASGRTEPGARRPEDGPDRQGPDHKREEPHR